jgi:hypothetical protein
MRRCSIILAAVAVVLLAPPALYAALVYWRFEMLSLSWYVPYEELLQALREAKSRDIFYAPIVSANFTSGLVWANMFSLSLGELMLSVSLGVLTGVNIVMHRDLHASCPARRASGLVVTAGSALASTLAASGTGILGCCGPALSGGLLASLGLAAMTAQAVATVSPPIQVVVIAALTVNYARLRRRAAGESRPGRITRSRLFVAARRNRSSAP